MRNVIIAASIAALVGTPASAAVNLNQSVSGYTYFHKAGATIQAHDDQARECLKSNWFYQPSPNSGQYAASQGLAGVIAAVIVDAAIAAIRAPKERAANLENCMVVHGWDVMRLTDADGAALDQLKQPELHTKLETMVGAENPQGELARAYNNDLGSPDVVAFATIGERGKSLSYQSLGDEPKDEAADKAAAEKAKLQPVSLPKLPKKPKTAAPPVVNALAKLPPVPEGSAVLIARMTDAQMSPTFAFRREGADPLTPAWVDGKPAEAAIAMPLAGFWKLKAVSDDGFVAVIVPPGHWILDSVSLGLMGVHLCYGAPAIDVAAGDVLYLGAFGQKALIPTMELDPVKTALQGRPELAAKLKAASYTNGAKGSCGGIGYGYAMEIPGAPYVDGYSLGSKARAVALIEGAAPKPEASQAPAAPAQAPTTESPPAPTTVTAAPAPATS